MSIAINSISNSVILFRQMHFTCNIQNIRLQTTTIQYDKMNCFKVLFTL